MQRSRYKRVIKVVLVSPGDVQVERDFVPSVIEDVNRILKHARVDAILELWQWETDVYPAFHVLGPQGQVDDILKLEDADFVIGVFWKRFGTPTLGSRSGTEHELRKAYASWKENQQPQIMLYFSCAPKDLADPDETAQSELIEEFRKEFSGEGFLKNYTTPDAFREAVKEHLLQASFAVIANEKDTKLPAVQIRSVAAQIRFEGQTDSIGDIILQFPEGYQDWCSILIAFGTVVSNRRDGTRTDAFLMDPYDPEFPVVRGALVAGNTLLFGPVAIHPCRAPRQRALMIRNIRILAAALPAGSEVLCSIRITGIAADTPVITAARIAVGLSFSTLDRDGRGPLQAEQNKFPQQLPLPVARVATLRYAEGFPHAFKLRARPAEGPAWIRLGEGLVQLYESSENIYISDNTVGKADFLGLAMSGTCVQAVFNNVPIGVRLFVSQAQTASTAGLEAQLTQPNCAEFRPDRRGLPNPPIHEVPLTNRSGVAIWEVVRRNGADSQGVSDSGHLDFGVWATFQSDPNKNQLELGTCWVNGSLAPAALFGSPEHGPGGRLPIPRFNDCSQTTPLFTITFTR